MAARIQPCTVDPNAHQPSGESVDGTRTGHGDGRTVIDVTGDGR